MGPPGVGKGTQAKFISEKYNIPVISTGDIIRKEIENETELGKKVKNIINNGKLLPDVLINEVIKERLSRDDCKNGFILDGYPRTVGQAKFLDEIYTVDIVMFLCARKETVVKRMSGRLMCRKCGTIYHVEFRKPKNDKKCDKCDGELYFRSDQTPDAIEKRIEEYERNTKPVIEYYKNRQVLFEINAERSIEKIKKEIDSIISKYVHP